MSLTDKHRWAVIIAAEMDYTAVSLHERIGEPMNPWRAASDTNKDTWEKRDTGFCYLRQPEGRQTSENVTMVREQFGFVEEKDARDWFTFFTSGPATKPADVSADVATQTTYWFVLTVEGVDIENDDAVNALYEAGCMDAGISLSDGVVKIAFHRDAASFDEAFLSAYRDVTSTGAKVVAFEMDSDPDDEPAARD